MKTAIIIGGQLRLSDESLTLSIDLLKDAFPTADLFFSVWKSDWETRREVIESWNGTVEVIEEYDIDYHPYDDNPTMRNTWNWQKKLKFDNTERHIHQTKQILNHNLMMKKYCKDYDVIVRGRYDSIISPTETFEHYAKKCYNEHSVMSFMNFGTTPGKWKMFNHYRHDDPSRHTFMVYDGGIIIHHADVWDAQLVDNLHNKKELLAAEFGWYQVLLENKRIKYRVYDGSSTITRCVNKRDMRIIKEMMLCSPM